MSSLPMKYPNFMMKTVFFIWLMRTRSLSKTSFVASDNSICGSEQTTALGTEKTALLLGACIVVFSWTIQSS
jgi:hypothetical protein